MTDYALVGTTMVPHPLRLLHAELSRRGCRSSRQLTQVANDTRISIAGLVTGRQRPCTASGVTFVTEHGMVIVWRTLAERQRKNRCTPNCYRYTENWKPKKASAT